MPVWAAMRRDEPGESIVVVPSTGSHGRPGRVPGLEERLLFLLLLLRQPRLRMIYVTSLPIAPQHRRLLPLRCSRA